MFLFLSSHHYPLYTKLRLNTRREEPGKVVGGEREGGGPWVFVGAVVCLTIDSTATRVSEQHAQDSYLGD